MDNKIILSVEPGIATVRQPTATPILLTLTTATGFSQSFPFHIGVGHINRRAKAAAIKDFNGFLTRRTVPSSQKMMCPTFNEPAFWASLSYVEQLEREKHQLHQLRPYYNAVRTALRRHSATVRDHALQLARAIFCYSPKNYHSYYLMEMVCQLEFNPLSSVEDLIRSARIYTVTDLESYASDWGTSTDSLLFQQSIQQDLLIANKLATIIGHDTLLKLADDEELVEPWVAKHIELGTVELI